MSSANRARRRHLPLALIALTFLLVACDRDSDQSEPSSLLSFTANALPSVAAVPGEVLSLGLTGSTARIEAGFLIRFSDGERAVIVAPFHVAQGRAWVMVPALDDLRARNVRLSIVRPDGSFLASHGQLLRVAPVASKLALPRTTFDAAVGRGLASIVMMGIESIDELERHNLFSDADAARDALWRQYYLLLGVADLTENLTDVELAGLQQLLLNTRLLEFLAEVGEVSLGSVGSQGSSLSSPWRQTVERALLKAEFAGMLLGEIRGMLALIGHSAAQLSATNRAAIWAHALSSALKPAQDLIDMTIPGRLSNLTAPSALVVATGNSTEVECNGRFAPALAFEPALLSATIAGWIHTEAGALANRLTTCATAPNCAEAMATVAQTVPHWVDAWLTKQNLLLEPILGVQSYTLLGIDSFGLDMGAYRSDVTGIVASLLNVKRASVEDFFGWVGIAAQDFPGVSIADVDLALYLPQTDSIEGIAPGITVATCTGIACADAPGWWAQWGFRSVTTVRTELAVYVQ